MGILEDYFKRRVNHIDNNPIYDQMVVYSVSHQNNPDNSLKNFSTGFEPLNLDEVFDGGFYYKSSDTIEYYSKVLENGGSILTIDTEAKQGIIQKLIEMKEKIEKGEEIPVVIMDSLPNISIERINKK